jgi:hypothetical protein
MSRPESLDYHIGRLLILLRHFGSRGSVLKGLTKLAKLDFLLRYPSFTDRLMAARSLSWPLGAEPSGDEQLAVESRMIRYKYGPWDNRYYVILGALVGLGLADVETDKRAMLIRLTAEGEIRAGELASREDWAIVDARASMLKHDFDLTGSRLKDLIYTELPDAVNRPRRVEI